MSIEESFVLVKEYISPDQAEILTANNMTVTDEYEIGDYTLALIQHPAFGYQIAIQKDGK